MAKRKKIDDEPFLTDDDVRELGLERIERPDAGAPARGRRSGPNIPEMDRRTVAVKLRLPREQADRLRDLADTSDMAVSAVVAELVAERVAAMLAPKGKGPVPASVHKAIVEALEHNARRTSDAQKHVIEELRAKLAKLEPKKRKRPAA